MYCNEFSQDNELAQHSLCPELRNTFVPGYAWVMLNIKFLHVELCFCFCHLATLLAVYAVETGEISSYSSSNSQMPVHRRRRHRGAIAVHSIA